MRGWGVAADVVAGCACAAYAWWATGVRPFTAVADVAVAVPVVLLGVVTTTDLPERARARARATDAPLSPDATPSPGVRRDHVGWWLVLLAGAVALEAVGLAAGGRSPAVPTLSTVVDHALRWHGTRCALYCGWLAAGLGAAAVSVARWVAGGR